MKLGKCIRLFVRDERGVTALEYGILAAVVAIIIGGTVYTNLTGTFTTLFSKVTAAIASVGA